MRRQNTYLPEALPETPVVQPESETRRWGGKWGHSAVIIEMTDEQTKRRVQRGVHAALYVLSSSGQRCNL
jgi:hypothetical protein